VQVVENSMIVKVG